MNNQIFNTKMSRLAAICDLMDRAKSALDSASNFLADEELDVATLELIKSKMILQMSTVSISYDSLMTSLSLP